MLEKYRNFLEKNGIILNREQIEKLEFFSLLVLKWNKKINLTAAKSIKEILERHIIDSLMPIAIGFQNENMVLDLGSGGGFPAIPLAVALKNTHFILVEKVAKKSAFLNKAKRELKMKNIEVKNTLLEEIEINLPETLITRAVNINKKILSFIKKKGVKTIYTFETAMPEKYLKVKEYTLPDDKKIRYIVKREVI